MAKLREAETAMRNVRSFDTAKTLAIALGRRATLLVLIYIALPPQRNSCRYAETLKHNSAEVNPQTRELVFNKTLFPAPRLTNSRGSAPAGAWPLLYFPWNWRS